MKMTDYILTLGLITFNWVNDVTNLGHKAFTKSVSFNKLKLLKLQVAAQYALNYLMMYDRKKTM